MGFFVRVNTGYFDQGVVVYNRDKIIKKYRQELFIFDITGLFGIGYQLLTNNNSQITKILCFLLILKFKILFQNIEKIEERLNFTGNSIYYWELFKLACSTLAMCHIVGTGYYFLAFCESVYLDEKNTWVDEINFWEQPPMARYVEAYYWGLATMTLIGAKPITRIETAYTICILIVTVGVFATILSRVSMVCESMAQKYKEYKRKRDIMTTYFELHDISNDLQGQLHNYLKYQFQGFQEKTANLQFGELIETFPESLQETVKYERFKSVINKFSIIKNNFTEKTSQKLINYLNEEFLMPQQEIFTRNVYEEPKLYLLNSGQVEIYQDTGKDKSVLKIIKPGQFFGENNFFSNNQSYYSARSSVKTFSSVLSIKRSQFEKIIKENMNKNDQQIFSQIRDDMLFNGVSKNINHKCYICLSRFHCEKDCKMINYYPHVINTIARFNYTVDQNRDSNFKRKKFNKFQVLKNQEKLEEISFKILISQSLWQNIQIIQENQLRQDQENNSSSDITSSQSFSDDDSNNFQSQKQILQDNKFSIQEIKEEDNEDDIFQSQLIKSNINSNSKTINNNSFINDDNLRVYETDFSVNMSHEYDCQDFEEYQKNDRVNKNKQDLLKKANQSWNINHKLNRKKGQQVTNILRSSKKSKFSFKQQSTSDLNEKKQNIQNKYGCNNNLQQVLYLQQQQQLHSQNQKQISQNQIRKQSIQGLQTQILSKEQRNSFLRRGSRRISQISNYLNKNNQELLQSTKNDPEYVKILLKSLIDIQQYQNFIHLDITEKLQVGTKENNLYIDTSLEFSCINLDSYANFMKYYVSQNIGNVLSKFRQKQQCNQNKNKQQKNNNKKKIQKRQTIISQSLLQSGKKSQIQ